MARTYNFQLEAQNIPMGTVHDTLLYVPQYLSKRGTKVGYKMAALGLPLLKN